MTIGTLFGTNAESNGLYGLQSGSTGSLPLVSNTYFEWFIFKEDIGNPATPTGGTWDFSSNTGTPPTGWTNFITSVPLFPVWVSIAFVDSRNPTAITWSTPGLISSSNSIYATMYADVFTGDGITTDWTLTADPVVVTNLDVSVNGVTQTPTTDYTISGTTFSTTTAAPLGAIILVKYQQALPNSYYGMASNVGFVPVGSITSTNVQSAIAEINSDLASSSGSSLIGYTPAGTGAVATTVQTKLRESVSVKDFGAVGNGIANDAAAFTAAWTASNPKAVLVPAGTYLITGTVTGKFYSFGVVTISSGTVTSITNLVP